MSKFAKSWKVGYALYIQLSVTHWRCKLKNKAFRLQTWNIYLYIIYLIHIFLMYLMTHDIVNICNT